MSTEQVQPRWVNLKQPTCQAGSLQLFGEGARAPTDTPCPPQLRCLKRWRCCKEQAKGGGGVQEAVAAAAYRPNDCLWTRKGVN